MAITIKIPPPLRPLTEGKDKFQVEAGTVKEALEGLNNTYREIKPRVFDEKEEVRRFVNIYINDTDIRALDGLSTPTKNGDVLAIFPAIAGG